MTERLVAMGKYLRVFLIVPCMPLLLIFSLFVTVPSAHAASQRIGYWAGIGFDGIHDPSINLTIPKIAELTAHISVPCIPQSAPRGTFHAWLGIGGVRTNNVVQAGITAGSFNDRNGVFQTNYFAWVAPPSQWRRFFPPYLTFLAFRCPDTIDIEISAQGHYLIRDENTDQTRVINNTSLGTLDASTGEFIVEGNGSTLRASGGIAFNQCAILGRNPSGFLDTFGILDLAYHRLNAMPGVTTTVNTGAGSSFSVS